MQHQFRVTGWHTGKAKIRKEAWVPTVSIHSPFRVYKFFYKINKHKSLYTVWGGGGGRNRAIESPSPSCTAYVNCKIILYPTRYAINST